MRKPRGVGLSAVKLQRRYQLQVSRYRLIEKNAHAGHVAHAAAQRATISGVRPSAASGPVSVRFPTKSRRCQPPLPFTLRQPLTFSST